MSPNIAKFLLGESLRCFNSPIQTALPSVTYVFFFVVKYCHGDWRRVFILVIHPCRHLSAPFILCIQMSPSRVAFQACSISMGCMKFTQWESEVNLWQQARVFDRLCFHHCMVAEVKFALVYCHLGVSGGWGVKRHWAVVKVETVTLYFQSMSCLFYKHKIPLLHLTRRGNKHKATSTMNAGVIHRTVRDLVLNQPETWVQTRIDN